VPCIKREAFRHEAEVRILFQDIDDPPQGVNGIFVYPLDRYSDCNGDFVLLDALSCGFEADGANESIKIVDDALIEAIELRSL
jgi:hypothetical protein